MIPPSYRLSVSLAAAAPLLFASACWKAPAMPAPPTTIPVRTALARNETIPLGITLPGFTVSPRLVDIQARVEGFLLKQQVADGSITKPDQVIYEIDARQYEAALSASEGTLAQAIAERDYAKKEMERNAPLVQANAISQQTFDRLVANYQSGEGQVLTAQADVAQAKLNLSFCTMPAPFAGILGASQFFEGTVVGMPGTAKLNTLVQVDPMWAQVNPSVSDWPKFAAKLAKGPITATVTYGGNDTLTSEGAIVFIDNAASTKTATLMMRAEFKNPTGLFRPGTYVEVSLHLGEQPNTLMVPQEAVFARETDLFVWRVKPDDTVETVRIEAIKKIGDSIALSVGPAPGDRIVVEGIQKLKAGSKVIEAPPAAATTP